ncbi:MAG: DUF928 domain-containing protein [Cyanobacteria bacterium RI_101]|nr:DUF928 domain-containing protein [Cyanobacteria bacterium RI_101]
MKTIIFALFASAALGSNLGAQAFPDPLLLSLKFPASQAERGAPNTTGGGGTRSGGLCVKSEDKNTPLSALVPAFMTNPQTTAQRPTLYFYIPPNNGYRGELTLTDIVAQTTLLRQGFTLNPEGGILAATLQPKTPLEAGQDYSWSLRIICNPEQRSNDQYLKGNLSVAAASLPQAAPFLNQSPGTPLNADQAQTVLKLAQAYADRGIWLDSLHLTALVRQSNPQDWRELLESVNLGAYSAAPFLP